MAIHRLKLLCLFTLIVSLSFSTLALSATSKGHVDPLPPGGPTKEKKTNGQTDPKKDDAEGADPVILKTGNFTVRKVDLSIPGRGMDFALTRTYRSGSSITSSMGEHWDMNWFKRIKIQLAKKLKPIYKGPVVGPYTDSSYGFVVVGAFYYDGELRIDQFNLGYSHGSGYDWVSPAGYFSQLKSYGDWVGPLGGYHAPSHLELRNAAGTIFTFAKRADAEGYSGYEYCLTELKDRHGNAFHLEYQDVGQWPHKKALLKAVYDTLGRKIDFIYDSQNFLERVRDFDGREVVYTRDANGNLTEVRSPIVTGTPNGNDFPNGKITRYVYGNTSDPAQKHNLIQLISPNEVAAAPQGQLGTPCLVNAYDSSNRVVEQFYGGSKSVNGQTIPAGGKYSIFYSNQPANHGWFQEDSRTLLVQPDGTAELKVFSVEGFERASLKFTGRIDPTALSAGMLIGDLVQVTLGPSRSNVSGSLKTSAPGYFPPSRPGVDPSSFVTTRDFNSAGLLVLEEGPGQKTTYDYNDAGDDAFSKGNLLRERRWPVPDDGSNPITTIFLQEPLYNQVRAAFDPRGNDASFLPPNGGPTSPARYMSLNYFDYQQGDIVASGSPVQSMVAKWGISLAQPQMFQKLQSWMGTVPVKAMSDPSSFNLGDINTDGETTQTFGNAIKVLPPQPKVFLNATSPNSPFVALPTPLFSLFSFNGFSRLRWSKDPEGNKTSFEYYSEKQPNGIDTTPNPVISTGTILLDATVGSNGGGHLKKAILPAPSTSPVAIESFYDKIGRLIGEKDGRGNQTSVVYCQTSQVSRITSPNGYTTTLTYDANDNVVRTEQSNEIPAIDANGHPLGMIASSPIVSLFSFDLLDHLVEQRVQADSATWLVTKKRYDRMGKHVLTLFPESANQPNNVSSVTLDERGLPWKSTQGGLSMEFRTLFSNNDIPENTLAAIPDAPETSTSNTDFNLLGLPWKTTDAGSHQTTSLYDAFGRKYAERSPVQGNFTGFSFDPANNVTDVQVWGDIGDGNMGLLSRTKSSHDEMGRLYQKEEKLHALGSSLPTPDGPLSPGDGYVTTRFVLDRNNRVTRVVDDKIHTKDFSYDGMNRLIYSGDSLGNSRQYDYDGASNPIRTIETEVDSNGVLVGSFVSWKFFDRQNRLVASVDNTGRTARLAYDSRNLVRFTSDAQGFVNQLLSSLDAFGDHTYSGGLPNLSINDHGNTVLRDYDLANRLLLTQSHLRVGGSGEGAIDPTQSGDGLVTSSFLYDKNGRLIQRKDDNGKATNYLYDALDRLWKTIFADGSAEWSDFDLDGLVKHTYQPSGTIFTNTYDSRHRLTQIDIQRGSEVFGTTQQTFAYDGLDRKVSSRDNNDPANGTDDLETLHRFDSMGREIQETQIHASQSYSVTRSYDSLGILATLTYPNGRTITRINDPLNRVSKIKEGVAEIASYSYLGDGRLDGIKLKQGLVDLACGYDSARRLRQISQNGATGLFAGFQYDYNRANRRTYESRTHDAGKGNVWIYDSLYRLTQEKRDVANPAAEAANPGTGGSIADRLTYRLDGANNVKTLVHNGKPSNNPVNDLNQYGSYLGQAQQHDSNGNRTGNGLWTFRFDAFDRMVETLQNGNSVAKYRYFANGSRGEKVLPNGSGVSFVYSQMNYLEERSLSGALLRQYVAGPGIDAPLQVLVGSSEHYYLRDALGSIVGVVATGGSIVERVKFTAYGVPTFLDASNMPLTQQASTIGNPFLLGGGYFDSESGLYYLRNRYYDPAQGRFVSRDPIGIWSDSTSRGNGYSYTGNDPANAIDPLGLFKTDWHVESTAAFITKKTGDSTLGAIAGDANKAVDAFHHQDEDDSYLHSMKSPDETSTDATNKTNAFIEKELGKCAKDLLAGEVDSAMEHFGRASHPAQDRASPDHYDQHTKEAKEWGNAVLHPIDAASHARSEGAIPKRQAMAAMDAVNKQLWDRLNEKIGDLIFKADGGKELAQALGIGAQKLKKMYQDAAKESDAAGKLARAKTPEEKEAATWEVKRRVSDKIAEEWKNRGNMANSKNTDKNDSSLVGNRANSKNTKKDDPALIGNVGCLCKKCRKPESKSSDG